MHIQHLHKGNQSKWDFSEDQIVDFLFQHLDQYGDPREQIQACMDFAMQRDKGIGGFAIIGHEDGRILGTTIINYTGMKGYIPSNILVYIAVDRSARGKGIGKKVMNEALKHCKGGVALHVEPDNPARYLYEKLGFTNKYLEMRWQQ
jgi:[ribosomal protein S18]-alanine N-acetyltransferase